MDEIKHPKGKVYYSMGEVAEMFDVNNSLLRFWEKEFDVIRPHRNKKGNRLFTPEDVDMIKLIYHLVKERNMKIAVAKKYIKEHSKAIDKDASIVESLQTIRTLLLELKQELMIEGMDDDDVEEQTEKSVVAKKAQTIAPAEKLEVVEEPQDIDEKEYFEDAEEFEPDDTDQQEQTPKPPFEEQPFPFMSSVEVLEKEEDAEHEDLPEQQSAESDAQDEKESDQTPKRPQVFEPTLF